MTEYEKLIQFSEKAEAKKNGRMTVVEVAKGGSCIIRNMETHDGIVNMIRSYCIYENGKLNLKKDIKNSSQYSEIELNQNATKVVINIKKYNGQNRLLMRAIRIFGR